MSRFEIQMDQGYDVVLLLRNHGARNGNKRQGW